MTNTSNLLTVEGLSDHLFGDVFVNTWDVKCEFGHSCSKLITGNDCLMQQYMHIKSFQFLLEYVMLGVDKICIT